MYNIYIRDEERPHKQTKKFMGGGLRRKDTKMTYMEFLTNVANGTMNDEVMAHATSLIEKENTAKANARVKAAEKSAQAAAEREPIVAALVAALTDEPQTRDQLVEVLAGQGIEVTPQAVSTYLSKYAAEFFTKTKVDKKTGYVKA